MSTPISDYLRDDPGTPLGSSGRTLREDGESHREAWASVVRRDPCSYCGGEGGTLDHIEPKSRRARGLGGAHSWLNFAGACASCNHGKAVRGLLSYLWDRAPAQRRPRREPEPSPNQLLRLAA